MLIFHDNKEVDGDMGGKRARNQIKIKGVVEKGKVNNILVMVVSGRRQRFAPTREDREIKKP